MCIVCVCEWVQKGLHKLSLSVSDGKWLSFILMPKSTANDDSSIFIDPLKLSPTINPYTIVFENHTFKANTIHIMGKKTQKQSNELNGTAWSIVYFSNSSSAAFLIKILISILKILLLHFIKAKYFLDERLFVTEKLGLKTFFKKRFSLTVRKYCNVVHREYKIFMPIREEHNITYKKFLFLFTEQHIYIALEFSGSLVGIFFHQE